MEIYAEHKTKEMHYCWLCEEISYKKKPMREVGKKWLCIDCIRKLKETMDTLKDWEAELQIKDEMKKQLEEGLGIK
ncbi:MAG: hypothetical protein AB1779_04980 [Candidatus Thermoplasmatota archaeon]